MTSSNLSEGNPKVNGFLASVVARKRSEVQAARRELPEAELRARVRDARPVRPLADALLGPQIRVIAEFKRASPSAGPLAPGADARLIARRYQEVGAAAISVLTDHAFGGSLQDLESVSEVISIPLLRKDFLVDPWQVWESRAAGADAALVVVAGVDDDVLAGLADAADEAGLGLLVEVHGFEDAERAAALATEVVGVNARDLTTLEVSLDSGLATLAELRRAWGGSVVLVAESGFRTPADVARARAAGADAVLVGEHLMRSADPIAALVSLLPPAGP
jgi:indole-3-glycerol phosphate synthase